MKSTYTPVVLLLSVLLMSNGNHAQDDFPLLEGPYLGQLPPGMTPEVFAPGIISTLRWEYGVVFTPDLDELYYIRRSQDTEDQELVALRNTGTEWRQQIMWPRRGTPTFSPDGMLMYLGRGYRERVGDGWSEPMLLDPQLEEIRIMRLTASLYGTYVFDEIGAEDGNSTLRYSQMVDGRREAPKPLPVEINSGKYNAHPFIAPDESYIIWDGQRNSSVRNSDLFISFQQEDGLWGEAIKMGDAINTESSEFAALVSPDGKYLFFNRNVGPDNTDTFWVDAGVIENLRPNP